MPVSIQDCIDYINTHIYNNTNEEVSAEEVKTAMLMMLECMQTYIPKGEFSNDDDARNLGNLQIGDTYMLDSPNDYGINKKGVHVTLTEPPQ
jgi:hypothetical protein